MGQPVLAALRTFCQRGGGKLPHVGTALVASRLGNLALGYCHEKHLLFTFWRCITPAAVLIRKAVRPRSRWFHACKSTVFDCRKRGKALHNFRCKAKRRAPPARSRYKPALPDPAGRPA